MVFFDIETRGLSEAECLPFMPDFEAPGNYKDAEKIAAHVADQKAKWLDRAALSPMTGSVLAIGYKEAGTDDVHIAHGENEKIVLSQFIDDCAGVEIAPLVGFNIVGFDLPFLYKRAWKHGLKAPRWWSEARPWDKNRLVIDLMLEWQCGDRKAAFVGLDPVARFLGLEGKTGDFGKMFGDLYAKDQPAALEYLVRDVELLEEIHGRICVWDGTKKHRMAAAPCDVGGVGSLPVIAQ